MEEPTPNFLTHPFAPELLPPTPQTALPAPKSHFGRWMFFIVLIIALVLIAPLVYGGVIAGLGAKEAKASLSQGQSAIVAGQLDDARGDVIQTQTALIRVRSGLNATGFWKSMPLVGIHIRAFQDAERAGTTVTEGLLVLLDAATSIQEALPTSRKFSDLSREEKRTILARIHDALPQVRIAREKATIALDTWERIPRSELIAPAQRALEPATIQLRDLQRALDQSVSLAEVLVPMMGYPKEKSYLVLPYSGEGSPDFPQNAERVLNIQGSSFSGVIALSPELLRNMRQWIGSFPVDGKVIGSKIGDALITALMSQPLSHIPELLDSATQALMRKEILIYDRDPALLSVLDAYHWSGRTLASANDYLWVVDTNLDGTMEKNMRYALDATDSSGPVATVTLSYKNAHSTVYPDNVRLYVPEGSELISSSGVSGNVDVYQDLGKTVFAGFWSIEPNETREIRFTYRLPTGSVASLRQGMYQLLVQKQPGTNTRLTLDHKFGKKVGAATPAEDPKEFGDANYRTNLPLDRDRLIEVKLEP